MSKARLTPPELEAMMLVDFDQTRSIAGAGSQVIGLIHATRRPSAGRPRSATAG